MSNDAINWAVSQRLTPTQKLVLMVLANRANAERCCWPSVEMLSKESSLSERSVQYTLRALSAAGIIEIHADKGKRSVYTLNLNQAPQTGAQVVQGCKTFTGATGAGVQDVHQGGANDDMEGCNLCTPTRASSYEPKEEPKENPKSTRARKPKLEKLRFGEFGNVRMTQAEYDKLMAENGERGLKAIAKLDAFIGSRGDKYKSHYMAMHSWVLRAVEEDEARTPRGSPVGAFVSPAQRRLDANREAGRKAKEILFGKQEDSHAATGL